MTNSMVNIQGGKLQLQSIIKRCDQGIDITNRQIRTFFINISSMIQQILGVIETQPNKQNMQQEKNNLQKMQIQMKKQLNSLTDVTINKMILLDCKIQKQINKCQQSLKEQIQTHQTHYSQRIYEHQRSINNSLVNLQNLYKNGQQNMQFIQTQMYKINDEFMKRIYKLNDQQIDTNREIMSLNDNLKNKLKQINRNIEHIYQDKKITQTNFQDVKKQLKQLSNNINNLKQEQKNNENKRIQYIPFENRIQYIPIERKIVHYPQQPLRYQVTTQRRPLSRQNEQNNSLLINKQKQVVRNWVDPECRNYKNIIIENNIISIKSNTRIFSIKKLTQKNNTFTIQIQCMKFRMGIGIIDSKYKLNDNLYGCPNWIYLRSDKKILQGGKDQIISEIGFQQKNIIYIQIDFQKYAIQWIVNNKVFCKKIFNPLKNKYIQWVPVIFMIDEGDKIKIIA